eukprot:3134422-Amphidinium_carterae.1
MPTASDLTTDEELRIRSDDLRGSYYTFIRLDNRRLEAVQRRNKLFKFVKNSAKGTRRHSLRSKDRAHQPLQSAHHSQLLCRYSGVVQSISGDGQVVRAPRG